MWTLLAEMEWECYGGFKNKDCTEEPLYVSGEKVCREGYVRGVNLFSSIPGKRGVAGDFGGGGGGVVGGGAGLRT